MEKRKTVKNKLKESKAITLIALIITIIVLLILAGVTISAISGNESVMQKAKEAKEKTDISNEKEAIQLAVINSMIGNSNDLQIDYTVLENNLNGIIDRKIEPKNEEQESAEICIQGKTGEKYIIDEDGTVMTAYEKAKKDIALKHDTEGYPIAIRSEGKNKVRYKSTSVYPDEYDGYIKTIGYIYYNDGTEFDTNMLKIENIGQGNIIGKIALSPSNGGFVRVTVEDKGFGTFCCFFAQVEDKYGNEFDIYTDVYNYYFSDLSANGVIDV